jgi:translation initiation factor IF-3
MRCLQTGQSGRVGRPRPYSVAAAAMPSRHEIGGLPSRRGLPAVPLDSIQSRPRIAIRGFAKQVKSNKTGMLTNERLVATIMKNFANTSPEDVQVRMLLDKGGKSTSDMVSLKEAIQIAVEEEKDMIEVSLGQEVPVIKVSSLASMEYQARKQKPAASNLPEKEFQVKAGIGENDLLRKMAQMVSFLQKGHRCRVRIRAARRVLTRNPQAVVETLEEVLQLVQKEGAGEPVKAPEFNATRNQVFVVLQAPAKKK